MGQRCTCDTGVHFSLVMEARGRGRPAGCLPSVYDVTGGAVLSSGLELPTPVLAVAPGLLAGR